MKNMDKKKPHWSEQSASAQIVTLLFESFALSGSPPSNAEQPSEISQTLQQTGCPFQETPFDPMSNDISETSLGMMESSDASVG